MSWPLSQDYNEAIQDPRTNFRDAELRSGEAVANALGIPMPRSGNFADVYEVRCPSGSRWAVKCFTREIHGLRERYAEISKYLRQVNLPFMVDFQYLEQGIRVRGQWFPVLKMQWVEGFVLNEFVRDNLDKKPILHALGQIWLRMARRLRGAKLAHGDLQHGNVMFVPSSSANALAVKLIDYDGMCVPSLAGKPSGEVGHPAYQHPERLRTGAYNAEVDRFSLLSIAAALRCLTVGGRSLWERYDNGDNLLFRQADLQAPKASPLFQELRSIGDPQAQQLVNALYRACQARLADVPTLSDLVPEEKRGSSRQGRVTKAHAVAVAAEVPDWDFSEPEEDAPIVRTHRAKRGMPVWAWGVLGGVAALVLLGAGAAFSLVGQKGSPAEKEDKLLARNPTATLTPKDDTKTPKEESTTPANEDAPAPDNPPSAPTDPNNPKPAPVPGREGARPPELSRPPQLEPPTEGIAPKHIFLLSLAGDSLAISNEGDKMWRLVHPRTMAVIREFAGHQAAISAVAFSADGSRAITGGHDKQMIVWEVKTARIVRMIRSASAPLVSVALSADGKYAAGTDLTPNVTVWNLETGQGHTYHHPSKVVSVAFSPNGEYFLCGFGNNMKNTVGDAMFAWSRTDHTIQRVFHAPSAPVTCLAASADGTYIALGHSGEEPAVSLWEVPTRKQLWRVPAPAGPIHQLAFSADGLFLLCAAANRFQLWHTGPAAKPVLSTGGDSQEFITAAFRPDSKAVSLCVRKGNRFARARTIILPGTSVADNSPQSPRTVNLEGETLNILGKSSNYQLGVQDMKVFPESKWSGDAQLWGHPPKMGEWADLELPVPAKGKYTVVVQLTKARDYGIVRFRLAGKPLGGPIDCYEPEKVLNTGPITLGTIELDKGPATLRVEATGTNPSSVGLRFMWGLDNIVLKPVPTAPETIVVRNPPKVGTVYLADLREAQVSAFSFAKKDGSKLNNKPTPNNLFTHPADNSTAKVSYDLGKKYSRFKATVGIRDGTNSGQGSGSPLTFRVLGDGKELWKSPPIQRCGDTRDCAVSVAGVEQLELQVACPGSNFCAQAIWAEPRLEADNPPPTPVNPPIAVKPTPRPRPRRFANKLPLPNESTIDDKRKQLRVMFRDDYKSKSKRALATQLLDESRRQGDSALAYVMLSEAGEMAAQDGDLATALRTASQLGLRFAVDPLEVKCRALEKMLSSLPAKSKDKFRLLAQKALLFTDRAVIEEEFDYGDRLLEVAKAAAAKADMSGPLTKTVAQQAKEFKAIREEFDPIKRLADMLETNPDNPEANLALGRYRCFVRGDWEGGLPLLALGSDKTLSELAQKDVEDPRDPSARAALGDAWFDRAEKVKGKEQDASRRRAVHWYQECLDDLDKKEQPRVKARLRKLVTQLPELSKPFHFLDIGAATISRKPGFPVLRLLPQQHVATRQLYRGPVDIRVKAVLPTKSIRITFGNGGEVILRPENNSTKAFFYDPFGGDPEGQGPGPSTGFVNFKPTEAPEIRIQVKSNGWSLEVNGRLIVGASGGSRRAVFAPSPVRVWSDDGEVDLIALVVKQTR